MPRHDDSHGRCRQLAAGLDLPHPFQLTRFTDRLAALRGRPLLLVPTRDMALGNLCGMWMATATNDYVFYEQDTSAVHQRHIVLHEIGHILLRHTGIPTAKTTDPAAPDGTAPERVMGRDSYDDQEEYEAELFASLVLARIEVPHATSQAEHSRLDAVTRSIGRTEAVSPQPEGR